MSNRLREILRDFDLHSEPLQRAIEAEYIPKPTREQITAAIHAVDPDVPYCWCEELGERCQNCLEADAILRALGCDPDEEQGDG